MWLTIEGIKKAIIIGPIYLITDYWPSFIKKQETFGNWILGQIRENKKERKKGDWANAVG